MVEGCERNIVIEAIEVLAVGTLLTLLLGLLLRSLLLAWLLGLLLLLNALWRRACKLDGDHLASQLVTRRAIGSFELFDMHIINGEVHELTAYQVRRHSFSLSAKNHSFDPLDGFVAILSLTAVIAGQGQGDNGGRVLAGGITKFGVAANPADIGKLWHVGSGLGCDPEHFVHALIEDFIEGFDALGQLPNHGFVTIGALDEQRHARPVADEVDPLTL